MSAASRRGACPSLSTPMQTGDGLLVRVNPKGGTLLASQLAGIAEATAAFGNGLLEITSRGSLQCRGLRPETIGGFTEAIAALGIEADAAPEIRLAPLAGLAAGDLADARPLAARLRGEIGRRNLAGRLAPKLSIVIDPGGVPGLGNLLADVRLDAMAPAGRAMWTVAVGGSAATARVVGSADAEGAVAATLTLLEDLAQMGPASRGRDLAEGALAAVGAGLEQATSAPVLAPTSAVGRFPLAGGTTARGVALPFSQVASSDLVRFLRSIGGDAALRLAPAGLLVVNLTAPDCGVVERAADEAGLVTGADDPRLRIAACAGSPSCASSHLPTKAMARAAASAYGDLLASLPRLHISGCGKQCARPAGPCVSVIGTDGAIETVEDGVAMDAAVRALLKTWASSHSGRRIPA